MQQYSDQEYPPQRFEDDRPNQTSSYMNEYNRYELDSPSKKFSSENLISKCTRWTLYFLPFIFFVVCFSLLIVVLSSTVSEKTSDVDSAIRALTNFNENIQSSPIYNVEIIESNGTCSEGYTKQIVYTWPGVDSGCICTDGAVYTSTCFARTSCPDVSEVAAIVTYVWEQGIICSKAYTDVEYITPGGTCPEGYRLAQSFLCVGEDETLEPIVKMEVLTYESTDDVPTDDDTDQYVAFPVVNSTSLKYLHVKRGTTLAPIVGLQAEISNPPCLDPTYEPETTSGLYYPLLNADVGCEYWGDSANYVSAIANETEELFNYENELDVVFDEIYDYSSYLSSSDYYKFYAVQRISLGDSELCNTIDGDTLTTINESSENLLTDINAGAILAFILCTIGLLLSFCYIFCRGCRLGTKYYCRSRILPITLYILAIVVCIILFCLVGYYYSESTNINTDITTEDYLSELITGECFTVTGYMEAAVSVESFLTSSITTVGPTLVFLMAWAIVFLVVFLICWVLRSCVKKLPLFIS